VILSGVLIFKSVSETHHHERLLKGEATHIDPPWLVVMRLKTGGSTLWKAAVLNFTDSSLPALIPQVKMCQPISSVPWLFLASIWHNIL
jgi:hypothetical protein